MTGQRQDTPKSHGRESWMRFWRHPHVRATVRHPLFPLAALIAFCLIVEESYPFSDFPMYSSLSPGTHYFYLTDENDHPLPVKGLFGISASELKKIYHSKLTPMAVEQSEKSGQRIKASELSAGDQALAGQELLDQLMPRADDRSWWSENHPAELRLIRVDIHRDDKQLSEDPRIITTRILKPQASVGHPTKKTTNIEGFRLRYSLFVIRYSIPSAA